MKSIDNTMKYIIFYNINVKCLPFQRLGKHLGNITYRWNGGGKGEVMYGVCPPPFGRNRHSCVLLTTMVWYVKFIVQTVEFDNR